MSKHLLGGLVAFSSLAIAFARPLEVTGRVEVTRDPNRRETPDAANVAVWLTPLTSSVTTPGLAEADDIRVPQHARLVQRNKAFDPHVLVVRVGALVEFPNFDPFFHNVFSLFEGKRFDLGLYEAGAKRSVHFDRAGICYIFCNIHPQMNAVVIVVKAPYYAVSDRAGRVIIPGVPPGRYGLELWDEGALPATLKDLRRVITVTEEDHSFGTLRVVRTGGLRLAHKNKYGQDYEPPTPASPLYSQP